MAHQAGEGEYPSNVMFSFDKAHRAGSDALDTDMLATKDGKLVLFHDETLEHRTNGTGYVRDKTYAELLQLDFAYRWTQDGGATFPYRGKGIKVATVEELFDKYPNQRFGIEIKQTTVQATQKLCSLIMQRGYQGKVLVSSSTQPNMNAFRAACPTVATSATMDEVVQFYVYTQSAFPPGFNPPYSSLQVPETFSGIPVLTLNFVASAHWFGLKVYAWTIDTPEQAQRLINIHVDGLNTSYPNRLITWLRSQ